MKEVSDTPLYLLTYTINRSTLASFPNKRILALRNNLPHYRCFWINGISTRGLSSFLSGFVRSVSFLCVSINIYANNKGEGENLQIIYSYFKEFINEGKLKLLGYNININYSIIGFKSKF